MNTKKEIFIGNVGIGGGHAVSIQSMTSTDTHDVEATLGQIIALSDASCDIVRVAVPDQEAIAPFASIVKRSPLPVVADIHFNPDLALKSIEAGAHAIRINPGNISNKVKLKEILNLANQKNIPIRIGVNSGSIEKKFQTGTLSKPERMVASVMEKVKFFEDNGFFNIKISVKSSHVKETVEAYRLVDKACDYPLHIGVTEAGTLFGGTVKSAVGIGSLLLDGIGSTIRVSLTDNPVEEVKVAKEILKATGHRNQGIDVISCPTCSRTTVDLIAFAKDAEKRIAALNLQKKLTVAIMGCEVNGPGEAMGADIGLAFSKNHGFIFLKGEMIEKIAPEKSIDRFLEIIQLL
ncbi:MAG: flavodoxin-dependent (E)-4-hydroxy-3-methylbut-2-enyl-diphosphate synthase [bacterium]|nr:flavodoxin-dependent (E)-4-hydroxy-3-methylbut-2-enyl-diphosphate synthase [bacterium]